MNIPERRRRCASKPARRSRWSTPVDPRWTRQRRSRWSTPISGYRQFGKRRIGATGAARWCRSEATGDFVYLEFFVDDITYDESSCDENAELEAAVGTALLPSSQSLRVEN